MNAVFPGSQTPDPESAFPSLTAMRAAHAELLQRRRASGDTLALLSDVGAFIVAGCDAGILLDAEAEREAAQGLLDFWANLLVRAGISSQEAMLADFDPGRAPELRPEQCPYRGLDAFRAADRDLFFGRQRLLGQLVDHLGQNRLLVVVGASGSGKSSLVLAGLLPALQAGAVAGSQGWRYLPPLTPGSDPLTSLIRASAAVSARPTPAENPSSLHDEAHELLADPARLARRLGNPPDVPAVVVVDQFEELFTLCRDVAQRQAFADCLLHLLDAPDAGHVVILTLRTDFVDQVASLPALQPRFEAAIALVTPLSADELREAIVGPAARIGLKFEDGLVDALVRDILGEPAGLPLLQFTLLKLWEGRERNRITWAAYRRLGGGRLALERTAEAFYDGLIPEEQVTCKRILLTLARPGDGLEVTRRRVRREALFKAGEAHDRVERVLERLVEARLVRLTVGDTPADTQAEVAHEALVRNWPRLVAWLDEDRVRLRARLHFSAAAEEWQRHGRDPDGLLRGAPLAAAESFDDLNEIEAEFVSASRADAERAEGEREAARQRELAQAHALADEQRRRAEAEEERAQAHQRRAEVERQRAEERDRANHRLRRVTMGLAAALVGIVIAVPVAWVSLQRAQAAQKTAATAEVAVTAARATGQAEATGAAVAGIARATSDIAAATAVRIAENSLNRQATTVVQQLAPVTPVVRLSPTASPARTPTTTVTPSGPTPVRPLPPPASPTTAPSSTPDRAMTAQAGFLVPTPNRTATAAAAAELERQLSQIRAQQTEIAKLRPGRGQGKIAFVSARDGNPEIYVVNADGMDTKRLTSDRADDWSPAWSPDSRRIAFTSSRAKPGQGVYNIFVTDANGGSVRQLTSSHAWDEDAAWSAKGDRIAMVSTADGNSEIFVMHDDGSNVQRLTRSPSDDKQPAWSPDDRRIAFSSNRGGAFQIWIMAADGGSPMPLTGNSRGNDRNPIWSPDGTKIAFGSSKDGNPEIYVINSNGGGERRLTNHAATDKYPAWSPDGSALAFWSDRQGQADLYLMWADGSSQVWLAPGPLFDGRLSWGR